MGCANAKPEVHTKKPPLNSNSNVNPSQISQTVQNQSVKPQPVSIASQNTSGPMQQFNMVSQNPKSNLSDLQKNPYLTREQVKQQISNKQQQFKKTYQQKPIEKVINQPIKTNNIQLENSPKVQKQNNPQIKQSPIETQKNQSPSKQNIIKSDGKNPVLSTIKQARQESELTKQVQFSFLAVQKKDDNIRISNSIFSSHGTPRMDDGCLVSNISKPTSSPLRPISEAEKGLSQSEVKVEQKMEPLRQQRIQKQNIPVVEKNQDSTMKRKEQSEVLRNSHLANSNISQKSNNPHEKSGQRIMKQNNQITTDEIKINLLSEKKQVEQEMNVEDDLFIPTEQNFDLKCAFQINNLIIDMNKVVW